MDVLFVFVFVTIIFWCINFLIANGDIMHPASIFCIVILSCLAMCVISLRDYKFTLNYTTVWIFSIAMTIFTLYNIFFSISKAQFGKKKYDTSSISSCDIKTAIIVGKRTTVICLFFLLIVAVFAVKYLRDLSLAYGGSYLGLSYAMGLYSNLIKFDLSTFQSLAVDKSPIYTYGWLLATAYSYVYMYIVVHNWVLFKKVSVLEMLLIGFYFLMTFLSGGRTYAFRVITFLVCIYFFKLKEKNGYKKGTLKFIFKMVFLAAIVVAGFTLMRQALGRAMSDYLWYQTLFSYWGAPLVNFDHYLATETYPTSKLWGQETFYWVYNIIGNRFDIPEYIYSLNLPFCTFTGRNTGNVYTMFYAYMQDFGFWGIFPLTAVIAWVYTKFYSTIKRRIRRGTDIGFSAIIYGYLFNDLIMLMFSNKFYETVFTLNFLITGVLAFAFWKIIVLKDIYFSGFKIIIKK